MNVVITGGTGFIGSNLAGKLDEQGHDVTAASLNPENPARPLPDSVERKELDVTDPDTIDFEGADAVVHLVGLSPLFQPLVSYRKIHVEGTENVVKAAEKAEVDRFVHMSALDADPEAPTEFLRTKGEAEKFVKETEIDHTILRPSVVFGDGDEFITGLKRAVRLPVMPLPGGGQNRFQPIYVGDMAGLIAEIVESGSEKELLELGGPEELSMREIVAEVGESRGRKPFVVPIPMFLVLIGLAFFESVPFVPFGMDQYRSLKLDNVPEKNDVELILNELVSLKEYLER